jgi:hypothetical protein
MAFLDNSGDILLDCVLTDTGRKRLSEGNFQIRKFALGDDAINYRLYNKNHPSGSAYFDLEILQTPVEVAHTKVVPIHHGLLSLTNQNLLYLPDVELNQKIDQAVLRYNNVVYLAVNAETATKLTDASSLDPKYVLRANDPSQKRLVVFESGLNTPDLKGTPQNNTYLNGLNDNQYIVEGSTKYFNGMYGTGPAATMTNDAVGNFDINIGPLTLASNPVPSKDIAGFNAYTIRGANNKIEYYASAGINVDTLKSAIQGPRSTFGATMPSVFEELRADSSGGRPQAFINDGKLAQNVFSTGQLYDYIDTFVRITGGSSNRSIQVPYRIIRYVSG